MKTFEFSHREIETMTTALSYIIHYFREEGDFPEDIGVEHPAEKFEKLLERIKAK